MAFFHEYNREANTVTVSRVGANAGFVNYINSRFYLNDKCFSVITTGKYVELIASKFLFYYLKSIESGITKLQSEGGVPTINTTKISSIKIPIPPLHEQERIVAILDKFDALVNDISAGLPAEIEARRKQYNYFRDKLLTFQRASSSQLTGNPIA